MFFDGSLFFLFIKEFCKPLSREHSCKTIMLLKQFNIHLRIRSQSRVLPRSESQKPKFSRVKMKFPSVKQKLSRVKITWLTWTNKGENILFSIYYVLHLCSEMRKGNILSYVQTVGMEQIGYF